MWRPLVLERAVKAAAQHQCPPYITCPQSNQHHEVVQLRSTSVTPTRSTGPEESRSPAGDSHGMYGLLQASFSRWAQVVLFFIVSEVM